MVYTCPECGKESLIVNEIDNIKTEECIDCGFFSKEARDKAADIFMILEEISDDIL